MLIPLVAKIHEDIISCYYGFSNKFSIVYLKTVVHGIETIFRPTAHARFIKEQFSISINKRSFFAIKHKNHVLISSFQAFQPELRRRQFIIQSASSKLGKATAVCIGLVNINIL